MTMDIMIKLTAVGYLGRRLQLLGQELQGLGYNLSSMDGELRAPTGASRSRSGEEFHHIAGTAARLRAQIEATLKHAQQLMFECESVSPKDS